MSDTPPPVNQLFIQIGAGMIALIVTGILLGKIGGPNIMEAMCLGVIGLFAGTIFISYKVLERRRVTHPSKSDIQKLGLDE